MKGRALLGLVLAGCGGSSRAPDGGASEVVAAVSEAPPRPAWAAWGTVPWPWGDEALAAGLRQAELDRDPGAAAIEQAWHHEDRAWRGRAAWAWGRIGGAGGREALRARLGDGRIELDAATLGAIALLDAPGADDEPRGADWDALEDGLWTRYALTEDEEEAEALLLAVARVGGARSPGRLAADLAVRPKAGEEPRYARGMEAHAILCARGYALTVDGVRAVGQGLEGGAVERRAAAYALGRCAAVSAELLAGAERGVLVERLGPMTTGDDAEATRVAWAALEGLGELPRVVPGWVLRTEATDAPSDDPASDPLSDPPSDSPSDPLSDPPIDWMSEVAAVRALAAHADGRKVLARRLGAMEVERLQGPRLHALRDALERLRPFAANEAGLEPTLRSLLEQLDAARAKEGAPGRTKALGLLACEVRLLLATRSGELEGLAGCASEMETVPPEHGERLVIEALVHMGAVLPREQRVATLRAFAEDPRPSVAAAALGALAGLDDPGIAQVLRRALAREDMGVVAAAAGAIATRAADESRRDPEAVAPLVAVIDRFDDDHAVETRIAAIDALGRLARSAQGQEAAPPAAWLRQALVPLSRDPSAAVREAARRGLRGRPELLAAFEAGVPTSFEGGFAPAVHHAVEAWGGRVAGLRLHTDAGVITIDTTGAPAPIAQANLAALAERGYFDGLMFHRVVPGFVIQGGDPRGDGYGGPGHVMPCEWSTLRYERGTVGIALAGKDTGGSQIFIAHDQPHHLDARYTVVGRVVEGLEVVDAIWPYDRITKVEVLESRPTAEGESTP